MQRTSESSYSLDPECVTEHRMCQMHRQTDRQTDTDQQTDGGQSDRHNRDRQTYIETDRELDRRQAHD